MQKGETAYLTQSLGGSYTVIVNGNMFRITGKDGDALGIEVGIVGIGPELGVRLNVREEVEPELHGILAGRKRQLVEE